MKYWRFGWFLFFVLFKELLFLSLHVPFSFIVRILYQSLFQIEVCLLSNNLLLGNSNNLLGSFQKVSSIIYVAKDFKFLVPVLKQLSLNRILNFIFFETQHFSFNFMTLIKDDFLNHGCRCIYTRFWVILDLYYLGEIKWIFPNRQECNHIQLFWCQISSFLRLRQRSAAF